MTASTQRRGAPLVALGLMLVLWVIFRVTMWQQPGLPVDTQPAGAEIPVVVDERIGPLSAGAGGGWRASRGATATAAPVMARPWILERVGVELAPAFVSPPPSRAFAPPPIAELHGASVRQAVGHQLLWLAALSRVPLPSAMQVLARPTTIPEAPAVMRTAVPGPRRWSGDAWLMWRRDAGAGLSAAPALPSYGASQVGVVIRYRLDPANARRPTAYARASAALERGSDREVALGLSLRPIAGIPLVASGEARVADRRGQASLRPAVFVVTELPPAELPLGVRAEAYGQAGYVGGKDGTLFVDGQLRLDRRVARVGPAELRVGAGAWGGAQERASRLDLGPGATLGVAGSPGAARLALDWRFRVAGKAAPASGPALTLSAGF